jgi:oligopeptide/dipeptide ABC transporter ATP-binding protein
VSALDVSVQAQVISLIADLKRECDTAVLFISHNLAVVRQLCDRVLVLYLGRTMEQGPVSRLYASPAHPYTRALIAAIPVPEAESIDPRARYPKAAVLRGELPSPIAPPPGCVFHTRCPHAVEICATSRPALQAVEADHEVACHRWRELDGGG